MKKLIYLLMIAMLSCIAFGSDISVSNLNMYNKTSFVFEAKAFSDGNYNITYLYNFGDGLSETGSFVSNGSVYVYAKHNYALFGPKNVNFTADYNNQLVESNESNNFANFSFCLSGSELAYNGIDENCNGADLIDVDNDGYCKFGFNIINKSLQCNKEAGSVGTDCDDNNISVFVNVSVFSDFDFDNYTANSASFCTNGSVPTGYKSVNTTFDCNDNNALINPLAMEIPYNGIDENCDGVDLIDVDNDGYCKLGFNITNKSLQCNNEVGSVGTDCNDSNINAFVNLSFFSDLDFDNYTASISFLCTNESVPTGYKSLNTTLDCNDSNPNIHPFAVEIPYNNVDEDCSGADLTGGEDLNISFVFPKFSSGPYAGSTETCWYSPCWHDKTLTFNINYFNFNITTNNTASSCTAELIEYSNNYTQNNYYFNMTPNNPSNTSWKANITGLLDGLYNLTVYCKDSVKIKTSAKTTWDTNNTNNDNYYPETYYNETGTDLIMIQTYIGVSNFSFTPNYEDDRLINFNMVMKGMKMYNLPDWYPTYHYYYDIRGINNSNQSINNSTIFSQSLPVYTYNNEGCYKVEGIDFNSTNWTCRMRGVFINSTHYHPFDSLTTYVGNTPYNSFGFRLLSDAGEAYSNYASWNGVSRIAITDMRINYNTFVNIDPSRYPNVSDMFYDGDLARHNFSFTNTGETINDYHLRFADAGINNYTHAYYYNILPNQTVYFEQNITIEANCTEHNLSTWYCSDKPTVRAYVFYAQLFTIRNNRTMQLGYSDGSVNEYAVVFKDNVNITYIPTNAFGSDNTFNTSYMKFRTDMVGNPFGIAWFRYNVTWSLAPGWDIGTLVLNNTESKFDRGIGYTSEPQKSYYCGQADCWIPGTEGVGGGTYRQYWNFRSLDCDLWGAGLSSYKFNITAGNHPHDQKKFSITQDDECG